MSDDPFLFSYCPATKIANDLVDVHGLVHAREIAREILTNCMMEGEIEAYAFMQGVITRLHAK